MKTTVAFEERKQKAPQPHLSPGIKNIGMQAVYFVISVLFSHTAAAGTLYPFGVAFCAAVQPKYIITVFAGGSVGILLTGNPSPYRYLGALVGAALLSWAVFSFTSRRMRRYLPALNAFACTLFSGVIMCAASGLVLDELFLTFAESIISGASAYFFQKAIPIGLRRKSFQGMTLSEITPVFISFSVLLMSLSFLNIGEFSPARVLSVFFILTAARYGGITGGAMAGCILGLGMAFSGEFILLAGLYGVSGFMAGVFSAMGQAGSSAGFLFSAIVMLALSGDIISFLPVFLEIVAAALVFLLLPQRLCDKIDRAFNANIDITPSGSLRDSLVVKLRFAGNTMSGVSQSIHSMNDKLRELATPAYHKISQELAQELCAGCNLKTVCWKKEGAVTLEGFRSLWKSASQDGRLTLDNLPSALEERCIHTDRLIRCYNNRYQEYLGKEHFENAVTHLREIVADQLDGMSDMLFDLSAEFEQAEIYDLELAERIKQIFYNYGVEPRDVSCVTDKFQRMRIEAHCPQPVPDLNNRRLHKEIASACGRNFENVSVALAGHEALLTYCERARLTLFVGTAQHASGDAKMCGDSVEVMNDGKGHQVLVLSDGMGTGTDAAIEGALASGMLARMLKAGFGFDCALRTVNSALLVKAGEESLATLDVVSVDLFNGRTEFYKAGASSSFVVREGKPWKVELPSLPAGILREVEFAKTSALLTPGDKIVLFSDGIADSDTKWLEAMLEQESGCTPQALADRILARARRLCMGGREDDMTVMVAEVQLNQ